MADGKHELVDPRKLGETIKEKVKGLFLDAIPEEKWDQLVEGEIKAFFHEPANHTVQEVDVDDPSRPYYGGGGFHKKRAERLEINVTAFRVLVFEALRPLVSARLQDVLGQEKFAVTIMRSFDPSGVEKTDEETGKFFEDLLREMAPDIVKLLFKGVFAHAAESARNALREAGANIV